VRTQSRPPLQSINPGDRTVALASVPPLVKTTLLALAPTSRATCVRACSIAARAALPSLWTEDGLPGSISARAIASATSGRTGVVALWSR
jgi:hypothetical protein